MRKEKSSFMGETWHWLLPEQKGERVMNQDTATIQQRLGKILPAGKLSCRKYDVPAGNSWSMDLEIEMGPQILQGYWSAEVRKGDVKVSSLCGSLTTVLQGVASFAFDENIIAYARYLSESGDRPSDRCPFCDQLGCGHLVSMFDQYVGTVSRTLVVWCEHLDLIELCNSCGKWSVIGDERCWHCLEGKV